MAFKMFLSILICHPLWQELHLVGDFSFTLSTFAMWPKSQPMCSKLFVKQSRDLTWIYDPKKEWHGIPEGVSHMSFRSWNGLVRSLVQNFWPQSLRELHLIDWLGFRTNVDEKAMSTSVCGLSKTCLEVFTLDTRAFKVDIANQSLPSTLRRLTIHAKHETIFQNGCLPPLLTYLDIGNSVEVLDSIEQQMPNLGTLVLGRRVQFLILTPLLQLRTLVLLNDDRKDERHLIMYAGNIPASLTNVDSRIVFSNMWSTPMPYVPDVVPHAKRYKTS